MREGEGTLVSPAPISHSTDVQRCAQRCSSHAVFAVDFLGGFSILFSAPKYQEDRDSFQSQCGLKTIFTSGESEGSQVLTQKKKRPLLPY